MAACRMPITLGWHSQTCEDLSLARQATGEQTRATGPPYLLRLDWVPKRADAENLNLHDVALNMGDVLSGL